MTHAVNVLKKKIDTGKKFEFKAMIASKTAKITFDSKTIIVNTYICKNEGGIQ